MQQVIKFDGLQASFGHVETVKIEYDIAYIGYDVIHIKCGGICKEFHCKGIGYDQKQRGLQKSLGGIENIHFCLFLNVILFLLDVIYCHLFYLII